MATSDIYRVKPFWTDLVSGKTFSSHWDVHPKTALSAAPNITDMGDAVKEWWDTDYGGSATNPMKAYYGADLELTEVTLRRIKPLEEVTFSYTTGLPIVGTNGTNTYDPRSCMLVSLRTDRIGRRNRGRQYMPCLAESSVVNGRLTAATLDDILVNNALIIGAFDDVDATVCVFSTVNDAARDVVELKIDEVLRTIKKRAQRAPVYRTGAA